MCLSIMATRNALDVMSETRIKTETCMDRSQMLLSVPKALPDTNTIPWSNPSQPDI
jgi:hypothetical protein